MILAMAGDSAREPLARLLADHLKDKDQVAKVGRVGNAPGPCYTNLSDQMASKVLLGRYDRAILCCGTGIGVCIAANKIPGIRAALTHDTSSAERAALSNNAQIVTMGVRVIGTELAKANADAPVAKTMNFDPAGKPADNVNVIGEVDARHSKT
jgi:D-erythrulose 4-phosphate isomerase